MLIHPPKVQESKRKLRHDIQHIRELYSRGFKFLWAKMWYFEFLPKERSRIRVYSLFFTGMIVLNQWSWNISLFRKKIYKF